MAEYDILPDHIWWKINGVLNAPPVFSTSTMGFQFGYSMDLTQPFGTFREEVYSAVTELYESRRRPLAICISGRDSEVIARAAADLGIPAKLYFLRFWGMDDKLVTAVQEVAKCTRQDLVVIDLTREYCFDDLIYRSFETMKQYTPSYLCLPALFENIPADEIIIVGEGDLAKGDTFSLPYKRRPIREMFRQGTRGVPILLSEIAYRMWAQENQRQGQYYFLSSTPGLILSAYNDPDIEIDAPNIRTHKLFLKYWPELTFTYKSFNWENQIENHTEIRMTLWAKNKHRHTLFYSGCVIPESSLKEQTGK
jgi:hypothetical protein